MFIGWILLSAVIGFVVAVIVLVMPDPERMLAELDRKREWLREIKETNQLCLEGIKQVRKSREKFNEAIEEAQLAIAAGKKYCCPNCYKKIL